MLEILNEILEAERRAEETVKQAREEAAKLSGAAEAEVSRTLTEARERARESYQDAINEARSRAEKSRQDEDRISTDADAFMESRKDAISEAVDRITDRILTPEYRRE